MRIWAHISQAQTIYEQPTMQSTMVEKKSFQVKSWLVKFNNKKWKILAYFKGSKMENNKENKIPTSINRGLPRFS